MNSTIHDIDRIDEGEGAAGAAGVGAAAGGDCGGADLAVPMQDCPSMSQVATSTEEVLGKCDHRHDGYMGKSCFHIPKKIMPTLHRWELCNGGSKRKKDKRGRDKKYAYEKGMKVITSYQDLVESLSDGSKPVFVFNIQHNRISKICDQADNDNKRFSKEQFMKYVNDDSIEFIGLFSRDEKKCFALAAVQYDHAGQDDCYIAELQSFKKGYGKALMLRILQSQEKVWLLANPTAPRTLVDYYRQSDFNLREHVIAQSCWTDGAPGEEHPIPAHFFYAKDCDEHKLLDFIDKNYADRTENALSESKNKITSSPKIIQQKKHSLNPRTTTKPVKVHYATVTKSRPKVITPEQQCKRTYSSAKPLIGKMMSRKSSQQDKIRIVSEPKMKSFAKSKTSVKTIRFPADEVKSLLKQSTIVTTRVSDDYDKFQIGDVVKASQLDGRLYKIIARCNLSKVTDHPMLSDLTEHQIDELSQYDKMSVLTLVRIDC